MGTRRGTREAPERHQRGTREETLGIERGSGGNLAVHFFEVASKIFAVKHLPPEMHQKKDQRCTVRWSLLY